MSTVVKRTCLGVGTCPNMHEHGPAKITLTYNTTNPLVVNFAVRFHFTDENGVEVVKFNATQEVYRESLHLWLATAQAGSTLELGEVRLRVRRSLPYIVTMKMTSLLLAKTDIEIEPRFMVQRNWLQSAVADTYVAVPAENESSQLDIDGCIKQILKSAK